MSRAIARRRRNGISGLNKARINPLNRRPLPAVLGAMSGASGAMMNTTPTILQGLVQVGIGALILNSFDERGIFSSFFGVSGVVGGTLTTVQAIGRGTGVMQGSPTRPKLARPSAPRATLPSPATWSRVTGFIVADVPAARYSRDFSFRFYVTTPSGTYAFDMPMRYGMSVWGIDDDFGGSDHRGPADIPRSFRTRMGHFGWKQLYIYGKTRARAVAAVGAGMAGVRTPFSVSESDSVADRRSDRVHALYSTGSASRLNRLRAGTNRFAPQADRSGDSRGASAQGFSPVGETAEQAYRRRMKQAVSRY